jgi:glucose-1-phosphate cytidylyltransferase
MTYGDGLSDIDIRAQIDFHMKHGRAATIAAVMPPGRYGALDMTSDGVVRCFNEKPLGDEGCINGGFFVLENKVLDRIKADSIAFEGPPLEALAQEGELLGWRHPGFWHAMDTVRDRNHLEKLWATGNAPWKVWL